MLAIILFLLFCAFLCKDRIDWAVLLVCGVFLLACSSSDDKSAGPARCLDAGTIDTGADLEPDGRVGADLGPDASPNLLPEALTADCLSLDTGSPDMAEASKADLAQAQDAPAIDAGKSTDGAAEAPSGIDAELAPLDTGGPCGPRQVLVNGTCQTCGGTGLRCCLTGDKCNAQSVCINEGSCFRCGDLGGMCCDGNTCAAGMTCKAGLCAS